MGSLEYNSDNSKLRDSDGAETSLWRVLKSPRFLKRTQNDLIFKKYSPNKKYLQVKA